MNTPVLTLGESWRDRYLTGIAWIRSLMGRSNVSVEPKSEPTPESLIHDLQALVRGDFRIPDDFEIGQPIKSGLIGKPPPLLPETDYLLIGLNAETARGRFVSSPAGGVVFEDPIWALLVAHGLSREVRPLLAIPKASNSEDLWERVLLIARAIEERRYQPENFLAPIEAWLLPSKTPRFELLTVRSEQVAALRMRGVQALTNSRPPKVFELYQPPISDRGLGSNGPSWRDGAVTQEVRTEQQ
jgi:hypothetical protein